MINRPARRILVIIAFVVLLAAAPPVSAADDYQVVELSAAPEWEEISHKEGYHGMDLGFYIERRGQPLPSQITIYTDVKNISGYDYGTMPQYFSYTADITNSYGHYGTALLTWSKQGCINTADSGTLIQYLCHVYFDWDWLNIPPISSYTLRLSPIPDSWYDGKILTDYGKPYRIGYFPTLSGGSTYMLPRVTGYPAGPSKIFYVAPKFKNLYNLEVDEISNTLQIEIIRTGLGSEFYVRSKILCYDENNTIVYESGISGANQTFYFPADTTNRIVLVPEKDDFAAVSLYTMSGPDDPDDPGQPAGNYKFTVSSAEPDSYYPVIKTGEDFTVSFEATDSLDSITHIFYTLGDTEFFKSNQEFGEGYTRFFKKVDGSWFKYNDDNYDFDIPSTLEEATFQTFGGPSGKDNTWKLLGVAKAGNANIVCDQTTHIQVEGKPIPEDQSKTGIRVYLLDAKTDAAIGKNAHIIVKNPFGEIVAEADTYKGFHDFIVDRPDPFNPNYKYEVSATIDGYTQKQPVFVLPLAIYPAYEIANIYFDLPIIPDAPEDGFIQFYVHTPNGLPIKDARIWMKNAEGREWLRITNEQGSTGFPMPKNATYTYRTESDIYRTLTGSITLTSDYDVVRLTLIGLESPTTPYVPTPTKKPGDDDEDIPSGNFLEQSCKAMATIFGVSLDIGKAIFGLILSLGIGTGVAKQLRGGAPEFALGFLGGLFLSVLVGLLPYWTIVVALLFAGVYAGRSIMDSGGGGAAKK